MNDNQIKWILLRLWKEITKKKRNKKEWKWEGKKRCRRRVASAPSTALIGLGGRVVSLALYHSFSLSLFFFVFCSFILFIIIFCIFFFVVFSTHQPAAPTGHTACLTRRKPDSRRGTSWHISVQAAEMRLL